MFLLLIQAWRVVCDIDNVSFLLQGRCKIKEFVTYQVVLRHSILSSCYSILRDESRDITASSPLNCPSFRYKSSVADVTPSRFRPLAFTSPVLYDTELHCWIFRSVCCFCGGAIRRLCVRRRLKLRAPRPTIEARTRSIVWGQQSPPTLLARVQPFATSQYAILCHRRTNIYFGADCDFQILVLTRRILFDCSIDVYKIHVVF